MAERDGAPAAHGYRVYSGAQRVLRFVSLLYLGWYLLIACAGVAATVFHLLMGFDVYAAIGAFPPTREVATANAVIFVIDTAFNLCVAVCAWLTSNHPVIARRFRFFAGVLVVLSIASTGYAAFFGMLANAFSGLYSIFITGLLLYLSCQIVRDCEAGIATDFSELTVTSAGKRLHTERQVERAIVRGEIPAEPQL